MQDERQAFSARFNSALDEIGVPPKGRGRQVVVAQMFGVTQKGARKWLEGESIPATKRLPAIAREIGVRAEWLLSGEGPRKPEERSPANAADAHPCERPPETPTPADTAKKEAVKRSVLELLTSASPRSSVALSSIAKAADEGRLTEADLELLNQIAERLARKE